MHRLDYLLQNLEKDMRLVEIGPSHNPAVAKRDGWKTTVVDYADADYLRKHYKHQKVANIEEVDIMWNTGELHHAFVDHDVGSYDAILSSHSLEHIPDLIRFLQSCQKLLKADGMLRLALPDKRCCFDFFAGLSTSGDMLAAYANASVVHDKRTSFNQVAYAIKSGDVNSWPIERPVSKLSFVHPLEMARAVFDRASDGTTGPYFDFHAWKFTPTSFRLAILELAYLGFIDFQIETISNTIGHEFFASLRKMPAPSWDRASVNEERIALLKSCLKDIASQAAALVD